MASGARLRSANEAFGRSRSGAFLITLAAEPGPPPPIFTLPCHGYVRFQNLPGACGITNLCPDLPPPGFSGNNTCLAYFCSMPYRLNPRHLPITLIENGTPFGIIPRGPCADQYVWLGTEWVEDNVRYLLQDNITTGITPCADNDPSAEMELCSNGNLPWPMQDTVIGMELTPVRDLILTFDGASNRYEVLPGLHYDVGNRVIFIGTLSNDGAALVAAVNGVWITVDKDLNQEAAQGEAFVIAGSWSYCGDFTLLEPPALNTYETRLVIGAGSGLLDAIGQLRLWGTDNGLYDGFVNASYLFDESGQQVIGTVLAELWQGNASGGSWGNNTSRFQADTTAWPKFGITHPVRIVSANYTGEYADGFTFTGYVRVIGIYGEFDETGTITRPGITMSVTGATGDRSLDILITGLTPYDGQYTVRHNPDGTFAFFDLINVFFEGDATGTWTEIGGFGESGTIDAVAQQYPTLNFTGVIPDKGGAIDRLVSNVTLVTALAHGLIVGVQTGKFWRWDEPNAIPIDADGVTRIRDIPSQDTIVVVDEPPAASNFGTWTFNYY